MTIDTRGRHDGYPDPGTSGWYVTDPSTGLTQYVEADAECTARGRPGLAGAAPHRPTSGTRRTTPPSR